MSLGFGALVLEVRLGDLGPRAVGREGFLGVQPLTGLGFKALGKGRRGVSFWGGFGRVEGLRC